MLCSGALDGIRVWDLASTPRNLVGFIPRFDERVTILRIQFLDEHVVFVLRHWHDSVDYWNPDTDDDFDISSFSDVDIRVYSVDGMLLHSIRTDISSNVPAITSCSDKLFMVSSRDHDEDDSMYQVVLSTFEVSAQGVYNSTTQLVGRPAAKAPFTSPNFCASTAAVGNWVVVKLDVHDGLFVFNTSNGLQVPEQFLDVGKFDRLEGAQDGSCFAAVKKKYVSKVSIMTISTSGRIVTLRSFTTNLINADYRTLCIPSNKSHAYIRPPYDDNKGTVRVMDTTNGKLHRSLFFPTNHSFRGLATNGREVFCSFLTHHGGVDRLPEYAIKVYPAKFLLNNSS